MGEVLVTGATGLVGSEFLRRLLTWDPDARVVLLVRPKGQRSPQQRVSALLERLFTDSASLRSATARVVAVEGDLHSDRLGLTETQFRQLAAVITSIYHLGADVRFDLALEAARDTHVRGTGRVLELARAAAQHGQLERLHHVSTFAAGRIERVSWIPEAPPILEREFRNTYEQTKAEAEVLVLNSSNHVPLTIHRVGIVVGDSRNGWTSKFDTFYMLIRLLLAEGDAALETQVWPVPNGLLNAVPVDFVADTLYAIGHLRRLQSGEILHYTAGARATPMVEAIRLAAYWYRDYLKRTGQPVPAEPELVPFDEASPASIESAFGQLSAEVVAMISQLTPYGFDQAIYDNEQLLGALTGTPLLPPPIGSVLRPIIEYPLRTRWGSLSEPRPLLGRPVV